ncbi:hypothetical protein JM18_008582, partial [Phytophthora kernoviae]
KHQTLARKRGAVVHFEFCGNLFFGSSVQILESVQKAVYVRKSQEQSPVTEGKWVGTPHDSNVLCAAASNEVDIAVECLDGSPAPDANAPPTEFVVMNFSRVSRMDSTAARSAFLILQKYCKNQGITVVFADACPNIRRLLLKNGIADEENFFVDAEAALEFCENQVLARTSSLTSAGRRLSHHNETLNQLLYHLMGESVDTLLVHNVDEFFHQYAANSLIKRKLCKDFEAISTQLETAVLRVSAREQEAQKALVEQQQDGRIVAEHQGQVFEFAELENEIAHNEALIEEREQDINKIHQSVAQVNEIFRDLAAIVQDQQGAIDDIETHVHESMQQTQQGLEQVKQASDAQSYCVLQ